MLAMPLRQATFRPLPVALRQHRLWNLHPARPGRNSGDRRLGHRGGADAR